MTFKTLTIATAIVFMCGLGAVAPASAQNAAPAAPAAAAPADANAGPNVSVPSSTPKEGTAAAKVAAADQSTPYGIEHLWVTGSWIDRFIMVVLAIMSAGTWYIFISKFIDQSRILGHSKLVDKRFWTSATISEGIEKLPKNSLFRAIAESGLRASTEGTALVGMNDWIGMSLSRQLEDANGRLQGGVTFLASVGSVAPFVGLAGTVWGILQALIAIGVAGQASIDKVAGPVGEALIMTFLGLAAAVPAVLLYNYLVRRNKLITEKLRAFAGDLQSYLVSKAK
jgi:biopolymer transport protein ExbB